MTQFIEFLNSVMNSVSIKFIYDEEPLYCQVKRLPGFTYSPNVIGTIVYNSIHISGENQINMVGILYRRNLASLEEQVVFDYMVKLGEFPYDGYSIEVWVNIDIKDRVVMELPTKVFTLVSEHEPIAYTEALSTATKDRRKYD